jgi:hypothetical protein
MESFVPTRRALLSYILGPAAMAEGLLTMNSAHSAVPDFVGIDKWLNTDAPLAMADLRGKVVLVEFCTYTCINWRRTLSYMNRWYSDYGHQGLQIIGIHTPEFGFERERSNVESALRQLNVRFPIAQDNEYQTWRAWDNRAWPSFYLLDTRGVRLVREGEGFSQEIENAIRSLLDLRRAGSTDHPAEDADLSRVRTPELYFGSKHPTRQDLDQAPRHGEAVYSFPLHSDGSWVRGDEALVLRSSQGRVRARFSAAKFHLVAGASEGASVRFRVDGAERVVGIGSPTLYTLLDSDDYGEHLLELEATGPGLSLFSATFG